MKTTNIGYECSKYDLFVTKQEILDAMEQHGGSEVYYNGEKYTAFVNSDGVYLVKKDQNIFQRIFDIQKHLYFPIEQFASYCRLNDYTICGKRKELTPWQKEMLAQNKNHLRQCYFYCNNCKYNR